LRPAAWRYADRGGTTSTEGLPRPDAAGVLARRDSYLRDRGHRVPLLGDAETCTGRVTHQPDGTRRVDVRLRDPRPADQHRTQHPAATNRGVRPLVLELGGRGP